MTDERKKLRVLKPRTQADKAVRELVNAVAPVLCRNKMTERVLMKFVRANRMAYAAATIEAWHKRLLTNTLVGSDKSMQMSGEYYGMIPTKQTGMSVNILNQNTALAQANSESDSGPSVDFNAIARKLAARRLGQGTTIQLPAAEE